MSEFEDFVVAQGMTLVPWQRDYALAVLSGQTGYIMAGRRNGVTTIKQLVAEYVRASSCPECVVGKHGNCDGTTWSKEKDHRVVCVCTTTTFHPHPVLPHPEENGKQP